MYHCLNLTKDLVYRKPWLVQTCVSFPHLRRQTQDSDFIAIIWLVGDGPHEANVGQVVLNWRRSGGNPPAVSGCENFFSCRESLWEWQTRPLLAANLTTRSRCDFLYPCLLNISDRLYRNQLVGPSGHAGSSGKRVGATPMTDDSGEAAALTRCIDYGPRVARGT